MSFRPRLGTRCLQFVVLVFTAALLNGHSDGVQSPRFLPPSKVPAPASPAVDRLRAGASDANVIIILVDAARADHFSSFGYDRPTTPNLEAFFDESVLFTEA